MSNILPNGLINSLKEDPLFDLEGFIDIHRNEEKINSIRFNPNKSISHDQFAISKTIPWCKDGVYLNERPIYTLDPFFHAGCYYSQEASSMFLSHAIEQLGLQQQSVKALDLCAAPGGKTTLLNSSLHKDSLLVANEIIKQRVNVLSDNLMRWGYSNVIVTNNDPSAFQNLPGYFDLMVVDAPCSGSGMFHKDHTAIDEWSLANVKLCSERQKRILAQSISSLKEDGYLFYSTCSYSYEENEDIVDWLMEGFGMETINIPIEESWGIEKTVSKIKQGFGYRFYPHKVGGEGFFFAALRKKSSKDSFSLKRLKMDKNGAPQHVAKEWMNMDGLYTFQHQDNLHVFPKLYEQDLKAVQNVLYLKNAGTMIGKYTSKELIPSHDLAMSIRIHQDIQRIDLDLKTAQNYLRKEVLEISVNSNNYVGWSLVEYKGINLGWVKLMPNRINNYYPKELRIAVL